MFDNFYEALHKMNYLLGSARAVQYSSFLAYCKMDRISTEL